MNLSLNGETLLSVSANASGAAQGTINGVEIDLASPTEGNFDSVRFIAKLGEVTSGSVCTLKAYAGNVAGLGSGAAYATTYATVTASGNDTDNNMLILDVIKPGKRYIRPDLIIGTQNAVVDSIIAERYNSRNIPVTHTSETADNEISVGMA